MSAMAIFILTAALLQDTRETEGKVPWIKDYAKALQASKDTGKPLFVFFGCC